MITNQHVSTQVLRDTAAKMILAARTAPKAKGKDLLFTAIMEQESIGKIAAFLIRTGKEKDLSFFQRDGRNLQETKVMVMLGTPIEPLQVPNCGFCGFPSCDEKNEYQNIPCSFNSGDLGIAVGSAASVAMDHRVDNRILFTAGKAAIECGILPPEIKIAYGIPLSATGKNPFFDRKK